MVLRGEKQRGEQIERVTALLASRLNKAEAAEAIAFARNLYARVSADDLAAATPEDLAGGAISLWKFGAERKAATAKVRAFNPRAGEQGWHCGHTVVEIVNDDMPFLVDSVAAALGGMGLAIHALVHPIVAVVRDATGKRTAMPEGLGTPGAVAESVMHIEIDQTGDPHMLARIETTITAVLADVRVAVADWKPILAKLDECIAQLEKSPPPLPAEEVAEGRALLAWMRDNNFTFLGYRENEFGDAEGRAITPLADTGLGILRDPARRIMLLPGSEQSAADAAPEARQFLHQPQLLMLLKANARSTVHRAVPLDYIAVKRFDATGKVVGERRFVGLFTSAAYNRMPADIPYLRRKMRRVIERSGLAPSSHDGKALQNILDSYPRDELFQISEEELHRIASEIVALQERPRIRLFVRRDEFQRFVSCLIYAPRERFSTELRRKFEAILAAAFHGEVTGRTTQIGDDMLARILIIVATPPGQSVDTDVEAIEARLVRAARAWEDDLHDALRTERGEEEANRALHAYGDAFDAAYREDFDAAVALHDLGKLDSLTDNAPLAINLHRSVAAADSAIGLKLYRRGAPVALSDVLPVLEDLGLRAIEEHTYEVAELAGRPRAVIHDFRLEDRQGKAIDLTKAKALFEPAFLAIWDGQAASDGFNRLVLLAGMEWRQVVILRAIAKYLRQAGIPFSQEYMEGTLAAHAGIARLLVALFEARFDPALADAVRDAAVARIEGEIATKLEAVQSLDEDRIVRRFLNVIDSAWRTNHYQRDETGAPKPWLAFKLDSAKIIDLPAPRPFTEVFVYSPKVEGIHLRGGKVARGGIRWSDRREDFRTEILGLIKAQQVKNAVIVPVGAKGGFVPMRPPVGADRDAVMADGIACYKTFITGVLELGDNLSAKGLEHPKDTVRRDGDDPYLVVAADKGTATFSDIANGISLEHGFWLGDAFASGGSAGYDHKKMGITARGAWELVKRHFRELGKDIQEQDFTVVGIGDMSGDVFGNGMLLSKHIKLVAAFDHRHIFLDPNPDPAKSWEERKRMFDLPRSSWVDYDARLISAGGGVHDRKAKSVKLTPEVQAALGLTADAMTPVDLMRAILLADADLLYVGGIGTYVKSSGQSQAAAGDRANDALRIDGKDLRVKVVGEGGNLGFTQLGRVEFAQKGGRINTDAIDNSAGVDCSDHEVNIKILFSAVLASGDMTLKQRDALLVEMTDEVGDLVLQDNYLQGQALTLAQAQGAAALDKQARFMRALERRQRLDRAVEYLPDDHELRKRRGEGSGLTRPELAVLLAYAKMALYDDLLAGDMPDDPYFAADLAKYFPRPLRKRFPEDIAKHRLRREIIATSVANSMVNRAGITFIAELQDETRASAADIARAYAVVRDVFDLRPLWAAVEDLDSKAPAAVQTAMLGVTREVHKAGILWLLRHWPGKLDIGPAVATYKLGINELRKKIGTLLTEAAATARNQRQDELVKAGAPQDLAGRIADLEPLAFGFDIVAAAKKAEKPVAEVGAVWFAAGARFSFDWLRAAAAASTPATEWDARAIAALVDDLNAGQRALTAMAVNEPGDGADAVNAWAAHRAAATDRADALLGELRTQGTLDLARLAIAGRALGSLVQSA